MQKTCEFHINNTLTNNFSTLTNNFSDFISTLNFDQVDTKV